MQELKIDPELRDLLPPLQDDELKQLEDNICKNGFDKNFPIMTWHGYIADGHNRYNICKKHNIEFVHGQLEFVNKDEVIRWILETQLSRRNLTPIQRILIAEKYRPFFEKIAKENQRTAGRVKITPCRTSEELSKIARCSEKTYRMATKILNTDNEKIKHDVLSGEKSIYAGYQKVHKSKSVSDKQMSAGFDYKKDIIEHSQKLFNDFYVAFKWDMCYMNGNVTKTELDECISHAQRMLLTMYETIEEAKNTKVKQGARFEHYVKALGFTLDEYRAYPKRKYCICCVASLRSAYGEYKGHNKIDKFVNNLELIKTCFDGKESSLQWAFIKGMFIFCDVYEEQLSIERIVKVFTCIDSDDIKKEAKSDKYTAQLYLKYTKVFVNKYNKGLKKDKRLKMSALDDLMEVI